MATTKTSAAKKSSANGRALKQTRAAKRDVATTIARPKKRTTPKHPAKTNTAKPGTKPMATASPGAKRSAPATSTAKRSSRSPDRASGAAGVVAQAAAALPPRSARKATAKSTPAGVAPALIDRRIADLDDWRGRTLAAARAAILAADPGIVEEWKWNVPVWSRDGIVCTGESYRAAVKLTFPKGASLPDPARLFNASLAGNARRAIDFHAGDLVDAKALTALVRAAIAANRASR